MIWTVISVSKAYSHRGNHKHREDTKKYWYVYYLNEYGKMASKRVNTLQALYYKTKVKHRYKFICDDCGNLIIGLVKSLKSEIECPYCNEQEKTLF